MYNIYNIYNIYSICVSINMYVHTLYIHAFNDI